MSAPLLALRRATNVRGALSLELRARVQRAIDDASRATWNDARTIIVRVDDLLTVWQAVLALEPIYRDPDAVPPGDLIARAVTAAVSGMLSHPHLIGGE